MIRLIVVPLKTLIVNILIQSDMMRTFIFIFKIYILVYPEQLQRPNGHKDDCD